jgi:cysteine desulfurase
MIGFGFGTKKRIYLDYASAPPVLKEADDAVYEARQFIGNPGAIHTEGVKAKRALDSARDRIAALLGVKSREIIFTDGLTEANNIAILGTARMHERKNRSLAGSHWIVSSIEHTSVLDCFAEIERLGGTVTHVDPDERGIIAPEKVAAALTAHTVLVSIGWANNEIGTIQPLSDIARSIAAYEKEHAVTILLHTDAGQAPVYLATSLNSLGVDLCSIGGNKLYGPHGIGCLFVSNRADVSRTQQGGPQERGMRPGTENVALALGFAAAFETIAKNRDEESKRVRVLRDALATALQEKIPGLLVNGDVKRSLPHMLNISIPNISSEYVTLSLDQSGIAVSTKSACREGEESRSHVVEALGGDEWRAKNTLRFSLGAETTADMIATVSKVLTELLT